MVKTSLNRRMVDQALRQQGTDLAGYIEAGRKQDKSLEEIARDLINTTGVPFTLRTMYRWANEVEPVS